MTQRTVIGIDAGGTKTVGLLAGPRGEILASARGQGANLTMHGELGVEKTVHQLLRDLESLAPELAWPPAALCLGIAGAGLPGQTQLLTALLDRLGVRDHVVVVHDATVALIAGAPERIGIVVVSGTGSIAYGIDGTGAEARSGGWGYLLGDEGSAFWLGHAAVRLGIRSADGRDRHTTLFPRIRESLGLHEPDELVEWFYEQDKSRHRVARLAGLVEEAALDGDGAASDLLDQAAHHLARAAEAVAGALRFSGGVPVVLAGGAFKACPSLPARLEQRLQIVDADVRLLEHEPAVGAVTLALRRLDSADQPDAPAKRSEAASTER